MDEPILGGKKVVYYAVLGAALIAAGVFLHYLPARYVEKKDAMPKIKTEYTGLELARELDIFAQRMETKTPGTYTSSSICTKDKGCRLGPFKNYGGWTTPMGYFELYRATGDEKYRAIADAALERSVRYECSIEGGGEDCMHYTLAAGLPYGSSGDPRYLQYNETIRPFVDEHIRLHEQIEKGLVKETHESQWEYSMHAGHILDFFMLTGEEKYRSAAVKAMESGKTAFKQKKKGSLQDQCTQFLTTVDFYRILKEEKYLKEAEKLIQKYQLQEKAEVIPAAWAMAFCMEGYQLLFEYTRDPAYETGLDFFMRYLMARFMDHPKNNYYTGDFAILVSPGWHETNEKHLGLNMWFMRIFAKMGSTKFSL